MGRRGSNKGFPAWYKGKLIRCDISGFWSGEREGKLFKQRGIMVDKANFDTLTDQQRAESVKRRRTR